MSRAWWPPSAMESSADDPMTLSTVNSSSYTPVDDTLTKTNHPPLKAGQVRLLKRGSKLPASDAAPSTAAQLPAALGAPSDVVAALFGGALAQPAVLLNATAQPLPSPPEHGPASTHSAVAVTPLLQRRTQHTTAAAPARAVTAAIAPVVAAETAPQGEHVMQVSAVRLAPAALLSAVQAASVPEWRWQQHTLEFVAFYLTPEAQQLLVKAVPLRYPCVLPFKHFLLHAKPSVAQVLALPLGCTLRVKVSAVVTNHSVQALLLTPPAWMPVAPSSQLGFLLSAAAHGPSVEALDAMQAMLADVGASGNVVHPLGPAGLMLEGHIRVVTADEDEISTFEALHDSVSIPPHLLRLLSPPYVEPQAQESSLLSSNASTFEPAITVANPPACTRVATPLSSHALAASMIVPAQNFDPAQHGPPAGPQTTAVPLADQSVALQSRQSEAPPMPSFLLPRKGLIRPSAMVGATANSAADDLSTQCVQFLRCVDVGDRVVVRPLHSQVSIELEGMEGLGPVSASSLTGNGTSTSAGGFNNKHAGLAGSNVLAGGAGQLVEGRVVELMDSEQLQSLGVLVRLHQHTIGRVIKVLQCARGGEVLELPCIPAQQTVSEASRGDLATPAQMACMQRETGTSLDHAGGGDGAVLALTDPKRANVHMKASPPPSGLPSTFNKSARSKKAASSFDVTGDAHEPAAAASSGQLLQVMSAAEIAAQEEWECIHGRYGAVVTAAVLAHCGGDVGAALALLKAERSKMSHLELVSKYALLRSTQQEEHLQQHFSKLLQATGGASAAALQLSDASNSLAPAEVPPPPPVPPSQPSGKVPSTDGVEHWPSLGAAVPGKKKAMKLQACKHSSPASSMADLPAAVARATTGKEPFSGARHVSITGSAGGSSPATGLFGPPLPPQPVVPPGVLVAGRVKVLQNGSSLSRLAASRGVDLDTAHALHRAFPQVDRRAIVLVLHMLGGELQPAIEALQGSSAIDLAALPLDEAFPVAAGSQSTSRAGSSSGVGGRSGGASQDEYSGGSSQESGVQVGVEEVQAAAPLRLMEQSAKQAAKKEAQEAHAMCQAQFEARDACFQAASKAYAAGDGKAAAEWSAKGRVHASLGHRWRRLCNELSYEAANSDVINTYTVDLHGLSVEAALTKLHKHLALLAGLHAEGGQMLLRVVTGKGLHSVNNVPLLKEAVSAALAAAGLRWNVDARNEGVLCAHLGRGGPLGGAAIGDGG